MTRVETLNWVEGGMFAAAVVLLGWCSVLALHSRQFQGDAARRLEAAGLARLSTLDLSNNSRRTEAPRTRAQVLSNGLVGRLDIPAASISAVVAEGTEPGTLDRAVGHLRGTSLPGEGGHVALAGHRDTFFRRLWRVKPGDPIHLRTPDGDFIYRVARTAVVSPDRTDVILRSALTLITCYPFDAIGPAPRRFIVHAEPVRSSATSLAADRH